jgi:hypothetical protein
MQIKKLYVEKSWEGSARQVVWSSSGWLLMEDDANSGEFVCHQSWSMSRCLDYLLLSGWQRSSANAVVRAKLVRMHGETERIDLKK